jgi:hypothetical protein
MPHQDAPGWRGALSTRSRLSSPAKHYLAPGPEGVRDRQRPGPARPHDKAGQETTANLRWGMPSHRYGLFLSLTLAAVQLTAAQTIVNSVFTPQGGAGDYGDPNNWSPLGVPNNSPEKNFNVTVGEQISLNIDPTVSNLTLVSATFLAEGHSLVVNDSFTNNGQLRMTSAHERPSLITILGALTNFDAGSRTLTGGSYSLGGSYIVGSDHPSVLQFAGADIVHNAATIGFSHPEAKIVDENGFDALRNFTHNTVTGVFSLGGANYSLPGNFTNDGLITVWDGTLSVNGPLTNFDPSTRTLTGGRYTLYWPGNAPSRFAFNGADIVNNAAVIELFSTAKILDEKGNDAFRNFAHNLRPGVFTIDDYHGFTAAGDFTNEGTVNILGSGDIARAHFTVPEGHRYLQTEGATSLLDANFTGTMEIAAGFFATAGNPYFGNPAFLEGDLTIGDAFFVARSFTVEGSVHLSASSRLITRPEQYAHFTVNGTFTAGGTLQIVPPEYQPTGSARFPVVETGGGIIGTFSNAPHGRRVTTVDGRGSFAVNYTPNSIFLSGYQVTPATGQLINISTRLRVETDENVLIGGFIISGAQPKRVIVRAIGPSLASLFPGALADPILELRDSSGILIASNDNWRSQEAEIAATGIPPSHDLESAVVVNLPAQNSAYTAIVRGANNGTGVGLVEIYDLAPTLDSKPANISTRGLVQTGDNVLIGGLIVLGQNPLRIIVRAIGPSLPVPGPLGDPTLSLHDGNGALIAFNDNWRSDQEAEIIATGIPPGNNFESAIVTTLPAYGGFYTAIVRGNNNSSGVGLVEVYDLH